VSRATKGEIAFLERMFDDGVADQHRNGGPNLPNNSMTTHHRMMVGYSSHLHFNPP
jgi:hypothetical protein